MSLASDIPISEFDIYTPKSFGVHGYPYAQWDRLRRESPIHFFGAGELPFWAITQHEDMTSIGRQPDMFLNGPRNTGFGDEAFERDPVHQPSRISG